MHHTIHNQHTKKHPQAIVSTSGYGFGVEGWPQIKKWQKIIFFLEFNFMGGGQVYLL